MMKLLTIKLNVPLNGFAEGREINIEVDSKNIPLDRFWRARLEDSKIDNCVEVIKRKPKSKQIQKPQENT